MSLFHYVTYKYIIIKDKRLGIAYYILAGLIVLYTTVQLFVNKSYLQFDAAPSGNMRILVNTPVKLQNEKNHYNENPDYCCIHYQETTNDSCINCRKLDGLSLNWPVESRAITIATFIKEKWQKSNNCEEYLVYNPEKGNGNGRFETLREKDYYTVNPEFGLVKIEHSVTAFSGLFVESHRRMLGSLVGMDGKIIQRLNSRGVSKVDKILLRDFLRAANITLDSSSDAMNAKDRTFRQNGVILHVSMIYKNSGVSWFGTGPLEYSYHVRRVTYSDYRLKQEIPIANNKGEVCERILNKRYAVRLEFHQGGKIGEFSWENLILLLVSSMGLLTLTATIIDVIALYIIPNKENYRQYVFDQSPEFADADRQEQRDEEKKDSENEEERKKEK